MKIELNVWKDSNLKKNGFAEIYFDKIIYLNTEGHSQGPRVMGSKPESGVIIGEKSISYELVELSKGDYSRRKFKMTHEIKSEPLKRLTSNDYFTKIGFKKRLVIKWWNKDFYIQKKEFGRRIIDIVLGGIIGTLITVLFTINASKSHDTNGVMERQPLNRDSIPNKDIQKFDTIKSIIK